MSIHKYKYGYYVKFQNKTYRGFKTKKDAKIFEATLKIKFEEEKLITDSDPLINSNSSIKHSFEEVANEYLKSKEYQITWGSYDRIRNIIYKYIFPNVNKDIPIDEITKIDCRDYYNYLSSLEISTSLKNGILTYYKSIFKFGVEYYNLSFNPSKNLEKFKKTFEDTIRKREQEMLIWNIDDFNKFISFVDNSTYKMFFILLFYTGARLGELQALQWKDFDGGSISIYKSATRKVKGQPYLIKSTKNEYSNRVVDLGENISKLLNNYKISEMKIEGFSNDWYIFGRLNVLSSSSITRIKDTAIELAQVKRIKIHDFRHSHATLLINNGINIVAVSKRLGHSDVNMTLAIYTHLLKNNNQILSDFIDKSSHNLLTD